MKDKEKQIELFFSTWQKIDALYAEYARRNGMSDAAMTVFNYIYYDETGHCTQKVLCEKTLLPKQTINSIINTLVSRDLVKLTEIPDDRRNKAVVITDTGKNFYTQVLRPVCRAELNTINQLDEQEWEQLVKLIDKYASIFRAEIKKI